MIVLDNRSRDILLILLRCNKPLVTNEISSQLDLTPRMVRYSLRRVKAWLEKRGVSLESRPNYGILIDCTPLSKTKLILELGHLVDDSYLSPIERLHVVILALLMEKEPVLVKQLEYYLSVSRPTVLRDLQKAGLWLEEHNLSMTSRPHYGFQVLGREKDRREAMVSLLLDSSGKKLLLSLCTSPKVPVSSRIPGESAPLREFLQNLDIPYSKSLLDTAATNLHLQIPDSTYLSILLHLSLLITRNKQSQTIKFPLERLLSLNAEKEFLEAKVIAQRIQHHFSVNLSESEVAFIAAQLLAASSTRTVGNNSTAHHTEAIDPKMRKIVEGMVAEASNYLHPCLRVDQALINGLALHLKSVIIQLLFDLPIRNPLLEHIKRQYYYLFQVARKSSVIFQEKTGLSVPEEEIGYITLHLGAAMEGLRFQNENKKRILIVCIEGVATAWLLVSRIRAELPEIEIVQVLSLLDLRRQKASRIVIDAIVATVPFEMGNMPVITINPLLRPEDISKLRECLGLAVTPVLQESVSFHPDGDISLSNLLITDTIRLKVSAGSWLDVVDKASEPLIASGAIELAYIEAIKQITKKYGAYAVTWPGIVLLHALPKNGVRRLCMSLTVLSKPVYFGHPENDPVDIALVIGTVDTYSHLRALMELNELLADESALEAIRNSSTRQEVRDIICQFARTIAKNQ